jgi:hypothetical protein
MRLQQLILLIFSLLLLTQCRKDEDFTTDSGAKLDFSVDTILYDTIFTTVGSITKRFTVYNRNDLPIRIDRIELIGGQSSSFRINVDGDAGLGFNDVEILGNDSMFVFVEATLDANNAANPLIIEDRIGFLTNGNAQEVLLLAWGQDAYFHRPTPGNFIFGIPYGIVAGQNGACENITWPNDKPHVVFGYAVVDSCSVLNIQEGTTVHFHNNSGMLVWRYAQLNVNGTVNDRVRFLGDRLEPLYDDLPGQWDRIWILDGPTPSQFNHVEIKNALVGIQAETAPFYLGLPTNDALILNNTNIQNCSVAGLLTRNYSVKSDNLLVANAGQSCIAMQGGGTYEFAHTTIGNYWNYEIRQTPAFYITNLYQNALGDIEVKDITSSTFVDGIIWGSNSEEIEYDLDAGGQTDFLFNNYIIRTGQNLNSEPQFTGINSGNNADPDWIDPSVGDYHLEASSPAVDAGSVTYLGGTDLDGNFFCGSIFDLGCYEFCP